MDISERIWRDKYKAETDQTVQDTWKREARGIAEAEPGTEAERDARVQQFYRALENYGFLTGGRIRANVGSDREEVTMHNCYVLGLEDSLEGIYKTIAEAAKTQKFGGGVGFDFSVLRPSGAPVGGTGGTSSGPVSFMSVFDVSCSKIQSAGGRRGAQMAVMRADHPDIREFVHSKRDEKALRKFNLSVALPDDFMKAAAAGESMPLVFQDEQFDEVDAAELLDEIVENGYDYAEPGALFVDTINAWNNLWYCEELTACNPCGEQPLPVGGSCLLGSVNLAEMVLNPFEDNVAIDWERLRECVRSGVRMLDNVIELSKYPLPQQGEEAGTKRRMGIGPTGLGDALIMMRLPYNSGEGRALVARIMQTIMEEAYSTSADLAEERGVFPLFDKDKYLRGRFVSERLPPAVQKKIAEKGIRNSHLLCSAPVGTGSLYAKNVSSGIEPVFSHQFWRNVIVDPLTEKTEKIRVRSYSYRLYCEKYGDCDLEDLPDYFQTAATLTVDDHLLMMAEVQRWTDASVSKTVNVPESCGFDDFREIYVRAHRAGLKGLTVCRPNPKLTQLVLEDSAADKDEENEEVKPPEPRKPLHRPEVLRGQTYRLRMLHENLYVTINDHFVDGHWRPFELFVNTKSADSQAMTNALMLLVSAFMRRQEDVHFLVDELKCIYDPQGGFHSPEFKRYIPSIPAGIALILERHLKEHCNREEAPQEEERVAELEGPKPGVDEDGVDESLLSICPKCRERKLLAEEGCFRCINCAYYKCG